MNTEQPLVSIIIPTYNRAYLIGETLDSVLAQTYTHWECIVVDDGSTDTTDAVLKSYCDKDARFKYVQRPDTHKPGGNGARNYGFELSKGEYIQWFDSDDVMLPEYLSERVKLFLPYTAMVICTGYSVDENLNNRVFKDMPIIDNLFRNYVLWQSKIMLPSVIFTKLFLKDKQLFDETLTRAQENEFFSRLFFKINKEQYVVYPKGLYLYRQHNKTKSFEDKNSYRSDFVKSMGQVSLYNLKRGIELNDNEIINHHYSRAIHYLFKAIHKRDSTISWFFMNSLKRAFNNYDNFFVFKLIMWMPVFIFTGRTVYKIEKMFKNKQFQ